LEHAQLLEDGIELTNPELMSEDHIRIIKRRKLAEAMKTVLTGEMFD